MTRTLFLSLRLRRVVAPAGCALALALTHCGKSPAANDGFGTSDDSSSGSSSSGGQGTSSSGSAASSGDDTTPGDAAASGDDTAPGDATIARDATTSSDATTPRDATMSGEATTPDATPSEDATTSGEATTSGDDEAPDANTAPGDGASSPPPVDAGTSCPANGLYPQTQFVNLAVPLGTKLTQGQSDAIPSDAGITTPAGWDFHQGGLCRDGSPAGFFVHFSPTNSDKLYIYLEGGGACDSATFCSHNPPNLETVFAGGAATQGQTIIGSLTFASTGQLPYVPSNGYSPGIFDTTNTANPFKDWNGVYVPYCTGDVHFGTLDDVDIPSDGLLADEPHQHFVGRRNLESYIGRIVPTFPNLSQVILTGASAGGFGAGLNYGMVQDTFTTKIPVTVIDDSGPPFSAQYLPACLQKIWRNLWGFDAVLPSDCTECFNADGSGLTNVVYYWLQKYPTAKVGVVTTMEDEVIRLFFSQSLNSCASNNATALTVGQALCGGYTCAQYTAGINDLLGTFQCTGRVAGYLIGGANPNYMNPTYHQHIFRDEFYQAITNDGGITMAQWASDFASGKLEIVGP